MSLDTAGVDGFDEADGVSDVCRAEIRGSTGKTMGAGPKLLLVYDTRLIILKASRLEYARSAGPAEGVVVALVADAVLQFLRAFGRRRNRQAVVATQAMSPADLAAAHPEALVLAGDSIGSVRLSREGSRFGGRHFVVSVRDSAGGETSFRVSTERNPTLRTSAQLAALFGAVFGDRFTNDAVEPDRPVRDAQTDRALVLVTVVALTIAVAAYFLPWMRTRYVPIGVELGSPRRTETLAGLDFGWQIAAGLGIAVVGFAIGRVPGPRLKWMSQVGLVATFLLAVALSYGAISMVHATRVASDDTVRISASPGLGLYMAIVVTVIALATQVALRNPTNSKGALFVAFACSVVLVGASAIPDPAPGSSSSAVNGIATEVQSRPHPSLFVATDDGFQAVFPTHPTRETPKEAGGALTTYTSVASDGAYSVFVMDGFTPGLTDLKKEEAAGFYGKVISSRVVTFHKGPAVESIEFERSTNHYHEDVAFVGNGRWYRIDVSGHDNPPTGYATFLASFKFAGPPASSAETMTTVAQPYGPPSEADAAAGSKALFDDNRAQLEAALQAQPDPKLTAFTFDTRTNAVKVAFAYLHPAQESRAGYDAFAWRIGQTVSDTFWFPELVQTVQNEHISVTFLPKLALQLDGHSYQCPALVQIAVAAHGISQSDWVRECAA